MSQDIMKLRVKVGRRYVPLVAPVVVKVKRKFPKRVKPFRALQYSFALGV